MGGGEEEEEEKTLKRHRGKSKHKVGGRRSAPLGTAPRRALYPTDFTNSIVTVHTQEEEEEEEEE